MRHLISRTVSLLGLCGVASAAFAITPAPFTANNPIGGKPVGWTFAGNKFVGSNLGNGQGLLYSTDLNGGNIQPFGGAVNLAVNNTLEHYVTASAGLGGFPLGDIYVASGNNVHHITNAGVPDPAPFINGSLGGLNGEVRGIMFDTVGTFQNRMIVTTQAGGVYSVDSTGLPTLIASTGEDTEGLDICPTNATWGPYNGWLFVASEGSGNIRAIKPNAYTMNLVTNVSTAEQLSFVPMNLGASGSPLEGLYSANYDKNILKMGASQFTGMQGDLIVTGEITDAISRIQYNGGVPISTVEGFFPDQPEDGLFVTTDLLNIFPEPASLSFLAFGATVLRRRR